MLFFTFQEQIEQTEKLFSVPGGSTLLLQSDFKTKMPGMTILLFIAQVPWDLSFVVVAGCLIIESLAMKNNKLH